MRRDAGKRDRWITIQSAIETTDPSGFPIMTWVDLVGTWAMRTQQSGAEAYTAHQAVATAVVDFEFPYRGDCDPELIDVPKLRRVVYQGRTHDIVEADVVGRREGLKYTTISTMRGADAVRKAG